MFLVMQFGTEGPENLASLSPGASQRDPEFLCSAFGSVAAGGQKGMFPENGFLRGLCRHTRPQWSPTVS